MRSMWHGFMFGAGVALGALTAITPVVMWLGIKNQRMATDFFKSRKDS